MPHLQTMKLYFAKLLQGNVGEKLVIKLEENMQALVL